MEYVVAYLIIGLIFSVYTIYLVVKDGQEIRLPGLISVILFMTLIWPFALAMWSDNIVVFKGKNRE